MKPLHASVIRLNRCPCCQSKYSKKNSGGKKAGNMLIRLRHTNAETY